MNRWICTITNISAEWYGYTWTPVPVRLCTVPFVLVLLIYANCPASCPAWSPCDEEQLCLDVPVPMRMYIVANAHISLPEWFSSCAQTQTPSQTPPIFPQIPIPVLNSFPRPQSRIPPPPHLLTRYRYPPLALIRTTRNTLRIPRASPLPLLPKTRIPNNERENRYAIIDWSRGASAGRCGAVVCEGDNWDAVVNRDHFLGFGAWGGGCGGSGGCGWEFHFCDSSWLRGVRLEWGGWLRCEGGRGGRCW